MGQEKFSRLINNLNENEFKDFVSEFIKPYWKVESSVIVDGPYDAGLDIKVISKGKTAIQVTVNKKYQKKFEADLLKIKRLIDEFDYSTQFLFFISLDLTEESKLELEKKANEIGIKLDLFDAKILASFLSQIEYYNCIDILKKSIPEFLELGPRIYSNEEKLKYDVLTFSSTSQQLKKSILANSIILKIYKNPKINRSKLIEQLVEEMNLDNSRLIEREFERLKESKQIDYNPFFDSEVELTTKQLQIIERRIKLIEIDESLLLAEIANVLSKFGIDRKDDRFLNEIANKLRKLYELSASSSFNEILNKMDNPFVDSASIKDFQAYVMNIREIKENLVDSSIGFLLTRELLTVSGKYPFLKDYSIGKVIIKHVDDDFFQEYSKGKKRIVYIDTQVAIYLICCWIEPSSTWHSIDYKSAVSLVEEFKKENYSIRISELYLSEVAHHVLNFEKLAAFSGVELFDELGSSSNVFLNFFQYLKKNNEIPDDIESISDFLEELGCKKSIHESKMLAHIEGSLKNALLDIGIEVYSIPANLFKEEKFEVKRIIEEILSYRNLSKAEETIERDAAMTAWLLKDEKVNSNFDEVYFLTRDNIFYEIRKRAVSLNPSYKWWQNLRPTRFLDITSLIACNFKNISIDQDLMLLVEDISDFKDSVRKVLDVLSKIVDIKSESGRKLVKEINQIRREYVYEMDQTSMEGIETHSSIPIDVLISNLYEYYNDKKGKYGIKDLVNCINDEENLIRIKSYLLKEVKFYNKNVKWNRDIYRNLDSEIDWHYRTTSNV
ncbi:hypothetical protein QWY31_09835 [Cytophagales bacterium LB-30]|uniref:Restriction endonuclease type IV Mrr domain-containing protein n=1 Tax=Shiella aurantiaca TaxID=3058365 RepID=A0ABT8F6C5_9BACT|nr:hypothetical protein [Shiella aurantiaca]MDN4165804.1 hypothetical protein [Shiella aurantiaca]